MIHFILQAKKADQKTTLAMRFSAKLMNVLDSSE
jgi:hypothetical protein